MDTSKIIRYLFLMVFALCPILSQAGIVKLEFDELPRQSVQGLTYQGVTFGFYKGGSPSSDAEYGSPLGPTNPMTFVLLPWLEGSADGTLELVFSAPVNNLEFGFSLGTTVGASVTDAINVELFDGQMNSVGMFYEDATSISYIAEGMFIYNDIIPITKAVINFKSSFPQYGFDARFGIDNLTFNQVPIPPVPGLLFIGFFVLIGFKRTIPLTTRNS